jgi:preprotein translocase subunit SecY
MPWIIAAVIVKIVAAILPNSWPFRSRRVLGRTYAEWVTNIVGLHIAAALALVKVSLLDFGGIIVAAPVSANSPHANLLGLRPYATSPALVFVALLAGAIFVRLLAEVVTLRGLFHGYVAFFAGELSLFIFRSFFREHLSSEWLNTLNLVGCVIACFALILIIAKHRPARDAIRSDKPKDLAH